MAQKHGIEFRKDAVRFALTSGLTRKQVAADLGIGFSTLSRWVREEQDQDIMSGPYEDQTKELSRLRKENRILRDGRMILQSKFIQGRY